MERLRAAIAVGDNQYFRGEGVKWTSESLDQLKREAD